MSSNLFPEPSITANTVEGLVKLCGITSGRRLGAGYFWSVQTIAAVSHSQQLENWVLVTLLVLRKLSHNHTVCRSLSLVPRPSLFFFVLWFAFSIIHGSGRPWKTGKALSHPSREWRQADARWTQKWGDQPQKQGTGSYVRALYRTSGLKTLAWSKLLTFTGKKLAFGVYSLHFLNIISSSGVHSHDKWDQAFLVFLRSSASVYYTERKPKNKKWGRPGNEATEVYSQELVPHFKCLYILATLHWLASPGACEHCFGTAVGGSLNTRSISQAAQLDRWVVINMQLQRSFAQTRSGWLADNCLC